MAKFSWGGLGIVLSIASIGAFLFVVPSKAESSSLWLNGTPTLEKISEVAPDAAVTIGNKDCTPQRIVTREGKITLTFPFYQTEQSYEGCVVQTLFGGIDLSQNRLQLNNSGVAKPLLNQGGALAPVVPIPNSLTTLYLANNIGPGTIMHYLKLTPLKLQLTNNDTAYKISQQYDGRIQDKAGNALPLVYSSIGFSNNAKWLIADIHYIGAVRINLETFEVLPFGPRLTYGNGTNPSLQTAITDDGRYAVIASRSAGMFRVYDLSVCGTVPQAITQSVACQYQDLFSFMQTQVPGFQGAFTLRFRSNGTFTFYGYRTEGGITKRALYSITAAGETKTTFEYLALGDSFASGEGAHNYRAGTDTEENKCHTSLFSYPYLIAGELNLNTAWSVACSGAVIEDVTSIDLDYEGQYGGVKRRERDAVPIFANFTPGFIAQHEFIDTYKPNIITLSTVGNDLGFKDKLLRCLEPDTCYSTYEDRLEILREINGKFDDLVSMYHKLKDPSQPNRKIYVLGYPNLVDPEGSCALNVHLNQQELEFAELLVQQMNNMIKQATLAAGVFYVDVEDAFAGSRLCETDSSDVAVNGLTAGNDIIDFLGGPIGNESYHPNALGHQLYKTTVLEKTANFTAPMPGPEPTFGPPVETTDSSFLDAPKTGRAIYRTNYDDDLANNLVVRQEWLTETVNGLLFSLPPLSPFSIFLNSEPVNLGTFNTDANGNLDFEVQIPESVPPGFHTLHVYGENLASEPIDIYKVVYVAANENDFDGDEVPNEQDLCLIIEPSGEDVDEDGIDDACDGEIGDPPANEEPPVEESKPPENNPETVAGNEPIVQQPQTEAATTTPSTRQNTTNTSTQTTAQTVQEPDNTGFPSVLAENNSEPPQIVSTTDKSDEGTPNKGNSNSYYQVIFVVLFLLGFGFLLHKLFPKPHK